MVEQLCKLRNDVPKYEHCPEQMVKCLFNAASLHLCNPIVSRFWSHRHAEPIVCLNFQLLFLPRNLIKFDRGKGSPRISITYFASAGRIGTQRPSQRHPRARGVAGPGVGKSRGCKLRTSNRRSRALSPEESTTQRIDGRIRNALKMISQILTEF